LLQSVRSRKSLARSTSTDVDDGAKIMTRLLDKDLMTVTASVINWVFPARVLCLPHSSPGYGWQASLERKTYLVFAAGEGCPP
jgi:hypothetical protein